MTVNTRRLFARLLPALRIGAVCDVGSMDGADALRFRGVLRHASIHAFEPNPDNFRLMQADPALREHDIRLAPLAVTNYDGEAEFFVVAADYSSQHPRRGASSLYRRAGELVLSAVVSVKTTRLDTFLAGRIPPDARLALWIDAEGKAYEVIEGAAGIIHQVDLLHVEVEAAPCIGANQRLYPEVKALLHGLGFVELGTDLPDRSPQFNALFVRRDLCLRRAWLVRLWLSLFLLRRRIAMWLVVSG
jgi:FkbM family methyltransferase